MPNAIQNYQIQPVEDAEVDYEFTTPNALVGSHANMIPMPGNVQATRTFYGARFFNQAYPVIGGEAPLVQTLIDGDERGRSFDEHYGERAGALHADDDYEVLDVKPGLLKLRNSAGETVEKDLYNQLPFNRKSVTGDSVVAIRNQGRIRRLRIEDYEQLPGDEIWSFCPVKRISDWKRITGFLKHREHRELLRVSFESGRTVRVTRDHSLMTLGEDWELRGILPTDCVVNLTKSPIVFDKAVAGRTGDYEDGLRHGLYLAEGHLPDQAGMVCIAVTPPDRVAEARNLYCGRRGLKPHSREKDCNFTDHELRESLERNCGRLSEGKFVSDELVNRSRYFLEGLVAGYFGGDGNLWTDGNGAIQVTAVTTSKQLRDDMVFVLHRLGIFTTLFDAPREHLNGNWSDAYGLRVISSHLSRLNRWFFYEDRQRQLEALLKSEYRASPYEHLPCLPGHKPAMYACYPGQVPPYIYKSASKGAVSKRRLTGCESSVGAWANSDIMWDKIVDISPCPNEEWVYDFEVEDAEAFAVGAGLLVHNSYINHRPVVQKGQKIAKGGLLAASNYTDDNGTLAMGLNARVGIVPYKGYSMDDAIVVSESFAKRLKSQSTQTFSQETGHQHKLGRNHFQSLFPDKFTKDQLGKVDKDGVVEEGTVLQPGDPIILATKPRVLSSRASELGKLSRTMRQVRSDASQTWDGEAPAKVMKVAKTRKGVKVVLSQEKATKDGDKITFRHGQKGTVSMIIPDEHMPRTMDGQPLEVLLNPQGMPSRANVSTLYEILLGKAAAAKGAPLKIPMFDAPGVNMYDRVEQALAEAGLTDTEEVWDPMENRKLENPITVGVGYIQRLHHTADSKAGARGQGSYDLNEQPAKGGKDGAKRLSGLETHALMSSGAYATLREGATIRGQKNDEYWRLLRSGHTPRDPDEPFVWKKFRALMSGSGLRMKDEGDGEVRLGPMTDADVDRYGPVEVQNARTLNLKTLEPAKGGLFDTALVGNNKWGVITLPEAVINPAFEGPVRHLLGLKLKDLHAIMAGEMDLPEELQRTMLTRLRAAQYKKATVDPPFPKTGPEAIRAALDTIDLDELEKEQHAVVDRGLVSKRRPAVQTLNAIAGLKANKVKPSELLVTKVPVVPPAFRPFTLVGDTFIPGDANELYKDLFDMREAYQEARETFGEAGAIAERKALQNAVKAVYGYADPVNPKSKQRGVSGFLRQVSGTNPKFCYDDETEILTRDGWVNFAELSENVDVGTINPNTLEFEWQRPTAYVHDRYVGDMFRWRSNRFDLLVTPNHRMWSRPRRQKGEVERLTTEDILLQGWQVDRAWEMAPSANRRHFQTAAAGWNGTTWLPQEFENWGEELFATWLGWWLAEGDLHTDGTIATIWQASSSERECAILERLTSDLQSQGVDAGKIPQRKDGEAYGWRFRIKNAKAQVTWLEKYCGRGHKAKRIPEQVKDWPVKLLGLLVDGYLAGDGNARTVKNHTLRGGNHKFRNKLTAEKSSFTTTSRRLYDDLTEIFCKLGITVNREKDYPEHREKRAKQLGLPTGNFSETFVGSLIGRWNCMMEQRAEVVAYDGHVHCCTVENGLLLVRRNEKQVVSGNSWFQRKLISKTQDQVARGVITPDPELTMDEIGVPESMAWDMYGTYVMRRLVRRGMDRRMALQKIKDRDQWAKKALEEEMADRPVVYSRSPAWHKYNIISATPKLIKGDTIRISPFVTMGIAGDFDGDTMNLHVPASPDAVEEARTILKPSSMLFSIKDPDKVVPRLVQEQILGPFAAAHRKSKAVHKFNTKAEALHAIRTGKISPSDEVELPDVPVEKAAFAKRVARGFATMARGARSAGTSLGAGTANLAVRPAATVLQGASKLPGGKRLVAPAKKLQNIADHNVMRHSIGRTVQDLGEHAATGYIGGAAYTLGQIAPLSAVPLAGYQMMQRRRAAPGQNYAAEPTQLDDMLGGIELKSKPEELPAPVGPPLVAK